MTITIKMILNATKPLPSFANYIKSCKLTCWEMIIINMFKLNDDKTRFITLDKDHGSLQIMRWVVYMYRLSIINIIINLIFICWKLFKLFFLDISFKHVLLLFNVMEKLPPFKVLKIFNQRILCSLLNLHILGWSSLI